MTNDLKLKLQARKIVRDCLGYNYNLTDIPQCILKRVGYKTKEVGQVVDNVETERIEKKYQDFDRGETSLLAIALMEHRESLNPNSEPGRNAIADVDKLLEELDYFI